MFAGVCPLQLQDPLKVAFELRIECVELLVSAIVEVGEFGVGFESLGAHADDRVACLRHTWEGTSSHHRKHCNAEGTGTLPSTERLLK